MCFTTISDPFISCGQSAIFLTSRCLIYHRKKTKQSLSQHSEILGNALSLKLAVTSTECITLNTLAAVSRPTSCLERLISCTELDNARWKQSPMPSAGLAQEVTVGQRMPCTSILTDSMNLLQKVKSEMGSPYWNVSMVDIQLRKLQ